jgi:phosphoribosylanthranilate isomerase
VTRVKICGITNVDDALWSVEQGADAVGFVFAESPRRVSVEDACAIREALPPFVSVVGVFVDPDPKTSRRVCERVGLDFIQLCRGDEKAFLKATDIDPRRLIRVVAIGSAADLVAIEGSRAGAVLLDTKVEGLAGGTGKTFDWSIAARAVAYAKPVILSGGLNPGNVEEAIRIACPQAVDVSSGVESAPGKKDLRKVQEFIRRAKGYAT